MTARCQLCGAVAPVEVDAFDRPGAMIRVRRCVNVAACLRRLEARERAA